MRRECIEYEEVKQVGVGEWHSWGRLRSKAMVKNANGGGNGAWIVEVCVGWLKNM